MSRRAVVILSALLVAACEGPKYAQFEPLGNDVATQRVQRERFSMLVPTGWAQNDDAASLVVKETPPDNGRIRAYRAVSVQRVDAVAGDDRESIRRAAFAWLHERYRDEGLVVTGTGTRELAGRECMWLEGSIFRSSIDLRFDLLACLVPGRDASLWLECTTPEGQFEAARSGFAVVVDSVETDVLPPRGTGPIEWFAGGKTGLRPDEEWTVQRDVDGCAAVLTAAGTSLRGEVRVTTSTQPFELDRLVADYATQQEAEWKELQIASIERGERDGRRFARVRAAFRSGSKVLVVDETLVPSGARLDRVRFVASRAEWAQLGPAVERAASSLRWR